MAKKRHRKAPRHRFSNIAHRWSGGKWKWRPKLTYDGEQLWGSLCDTQEAAYELYKQLLAEAQEMPMQSQTLLACVDKLVAACVRKGGSPYTVAGYRSRMGRLLKLIPPETYVHEVTKADIEKLMVDRRTKHKVSTNTLRDDLTVLHRLFRVAGIHDDKNPVRQVERPAPRDPIRPFFAYDVIKAAIAKIRASGDPDGEFDADLMTAVAATGIRNREISRVLIEHVSNGVIQVPRKGGGYRALRYSLEIAPVFDRLIARSRSLGSELLLTKDESYLSHAMNYWAQTLPLKNLTARNLRRSYATAMHELAPMASVQDQMGHKHLATTQKYLRARDELTQGAVSQLTQRLLGGGSSPAGASAAAP